MILDTNSDFLIAVSCASVCYLVLSNIFKLKLGLFYAVCQCQYVHKCYANVDNRNGREQTEEPAKA